MKRIDMNITITLSGPLLTRSSTAGAYGLDTAMARDAENTPIFSDSHVIGKLRESLCTLVDAGIYTSTDIATLFGERINGTPNWTPHPKRLTASDFVLLGEKLEDVRIRIAIDPERKAARQGAIQFMENLFASGISYRFKGVFRYLTKDEDDDNRIVTMVRDGLRNLTQLGGERGIGYGRVENVEIEIQETPMVAPSPNTKMTKSFALLIKPTEPFCLTGRRLAGNLFMGREDIPGAAIAGILARTWSIMLGKPTPITLDFDPDRPELSRHFNSICFSHAFPAREESFRPVRWPLSLVRVNDNIHDIACYCGLNNAILINNQAPAFFVDWKKFGDVEELFGWADLKRELRVRTAIDSSKRRSANEELFAYQMVLPNPNGWLSKVDLSAVPVGDREKTGEQIRELLSLGLLGLGKTKAFATVDFLVPDDDVIPVFSSDPDHLLDGGWYITLQTSALLCDPSGLDESSGYKDLFDAYKNTWDELSKGTLELNGYFARQSLAGGEYLANRFRNGNSRSYTPWLLTEPGSVFFLKPVQSADPDVARKYINDWLSGGLPLPKWVQARDWRKCPYLPQNGYGEIAVNLDTQKGNHKHGLRPSSDTVTVIGPTKEVVS